jgi:hypothetical protein
MVTYCVMTGARHAVLVLPSSDAVEPSSYAVPNPNGTISIDVVKFYVANRTVDAWHGSAERFMLALTKSQRPPADGQSSSGKATFRVP